MPKHSIQKLLRQIQAKKNQNLPRFAFGVTFGIHSVYVASPTDLLSHRSISDTVCGWQHLTNLAVLNLDRAGFMHVAQLASLTTLGLCSKEDMTLYPPDFHSGPTFPALEYLYIRCETARFCTGIIQVISSRQLDRLFIQPMVSWTTSTWQKLHTTLSNCLDYTALKFIEVEEGGNVSTRPPNMAPWVLTADALRPLLAFDKLSSIVYQLYSGVDFDDYFLDEMTQAWSGARTLKFDTEVLIVPPPRATLGCLLSFARNCSVLETLGIRMDATHVPKFTREPGDRLEGSVGYLHIGPSRINTVKEGAVAAFIPSVFPALEGVYVFESETQLLPEPLEVYAASWRRVADLVPVFASVRTQEEEFWSVEVDDGEESEGDGVNLPPDLVPIEQAPV